MGMSYIYNEVEHLVKKYKSRNPFDILSAMNVVVKESGAYQKLKGYCFSANRTVYVVINETLHPAEKLIVAAHELAHIILHKNMLQMAPMKDSVLYDMKSETEYEANLFAADLLIADEDISDMSKDEDMDYFKMCQCLNTSPDLMSFKLFSLIKRGYPYPMPPLDMNSTFLGKTTNANTTTES